MIRQELWVFTRDILINFYTNYTIFMRFIICVNCRQVNKYSTHEKINGFIKSITNTRSIIRLAWSTHVKIWSGKNQLTSIFKSLVLESRLLLFLLRVCISNQKQNVFTVNIPVLQLHSCMFNYFSLACRLT